MKYLITKNGKFFENMLSNGQHKWTDVRSQAGKFALGNALTRVKRLQPSYATKIKIEPETKEKK